MLGDWAPPGLSEVQTAHLGLPTSLPHGLPPRIPTGTRGTLRVCLSQRQRRSGPRSPALGRRRSRTCGQQRQPWDCGAAHSLVRASLQQGPGIGEGALRLQDVVSAQLPAADRGAEPGRSRTSCSPPGPRPAETAIFSRSPRSRLHGRGRRRASLAGLAAPPLRGFCSGLTAAVLQLGGEEGAALCCSTGSFPGFWGELERERRYWEAKLSQSP